MFAVCSACNDGWDAIGYLFFFLPSVWLLLVSGLGWGIWALIPKKEADTGDTVVKILKKVLGFLCWVIIFLCFVDYLRLGYDCFITYRYLQSIHASGSEYLGLFGAPVLFLGISIAAVVAYGSYRKLTVNCFQTGGMVITVFVAGLLLVIGVVAMQAYY